MPSGGVCGVLSCMPMICCAAASAAAGSSASLMPPPLPRPPACTCALTTTLPPRRCAISRAPGGVSVTSPLGTLTPNSRRRAFAWYSWTFMRLDRLFARAAELAQQPHDGIEVVGHALFHRDDAVVGDVDVLGAHLRAALGDVAEADPRLLAHEVGAVDRIERVHVEA